MYRFRDFCQGRDMLNVFMSATVLIFRVVPREEKSYWLELAEMPDMACPNAALFLHPLCFGWKHRTLNRMWLRLFVLVFEDVKLDLDTADRIRVQPLKLFTCHAVG